MRNLSDRVFEGADVIDSRDVIERIEELETEREAHEDDVEALAQWDADDDTGGELKRLRALADEASGSPDWTHGEALVSDAYWVRYAQELADDIGATDRDAKWPQTCIDWDQAARELAQDYYTVSYGKTDYWIRS